MLPVYRDLMGGKPFDPNRTASSSSSSAQQNQPRSARIINATSPANKTAAGPPTGINLNGATRTKIVITPVPSVTSSEDTTNTTSAFVKLSGDLVDGQYEVESSSLGVDVGKSSDRAKRPKGSRQLFLSLTRRLWDLYLQRLEKSPLQTKIETASVCGVLSEFLSSFVIMKQRDPQQLLRGFWNQIFLSVVFRGPVMHYWTTWLNGFVARKNLASTKLNVAMKVLIHESVYDPSFVIAFLFLLRLVRGLSVKESFAGAKREFGKALRTQYSIWPMIQCLTYALVPPKLQVGFITFVAIFTNAYLTFLSTRK
ncbi:unnamed protein product [Amoebophrya sp. A120]|nr:unnamed protein product [Amoebophrya sp. A120]|eukprot:GSA120T00016908001.1